MLEGYESRQLFYLLESNTVTVPQARLMRAPTPPDQVLRDYRDDLLLLLCNAPLGEAGPRSGLTQLQMFGSAYLREPDEWERELTDPVGRHLLRVAATVNHENRQDKRWQVLRPLGSPGATDSQCALNVHTRVACGRVRDGLMHPALAASLIVSADGCVGRPPPDLEGHRVITAVTPLLDAWQRTTRDRDIVESEMTALFATATWPSPVPEYSA